VFKKLDANDAVEAGTGELVIDYIASYNSKVGETLSFSNGVNIQLLRARVGEGGNLRIW
jgi:hypothetical protein